MKHIYLIIALVLAGLSLSYVSYAITTRQAAVTPNRVSESTVLATTTSATSSPQNIEGAKSVTLFLSEAGPTGLATTTFSTQVSLDNSTWVNYNMLVTNAATTSRVASVTMTGTSTVSYTMNLIGDGYRSFRCIAAMTGTTTGTPTATCDALIAF